MPFEKRLEELASLIGGRLAGHGDTLISGIAPIEEAGPGEITLLSDQRHLKLLGSCRASARGSSSRARTPHPRPSSWAASS